MKNEIAIFYPILGGGDKCGRIDLGRCLSKNTSCQETKMHGPGSQIQIPIAWIYMEMGEVYL